MLMLLLAEGENRDQLVPCYQGDEHISIDMSPWGKEAQPGRTKFPVDQLSEVLAVHHAVLQLASFAGRFSSLGSTNDFV